MNMRENSPKSLVCAILEQISSYERFLQEAHCDIGLHCA